MSRFVPTVSASLAIAAIPLILVAAAGQIPLEHSPNESRGVAAVLAPGMGVTLREKAGGFEIAVLKGVPGPRSHKVVEVGADYIAVTDLAGITQTHIPIYSLACVTVTDPGR